MKNTNYYLKMEEHFLYVPYYNRTRRIRVLLPKDYYTDTWDSYAVLYMHDGQNIFYSKESYSGYSWKIIPTIKHHKEFPKIIIVGIDNSGVDRLDEYGPWRTDVGSSPEIKKCGGKGMEYGKWVLRSLNHSLINITALNHKKNILCLPAVPWEELSLPIWGQHIHKFLDI